MDKIKGLKATIIYPLNLEKIYNNNNKIHHDINTIDKIKIFKATIIQCPPLILAPLVNMTKGGCENKSALFILFIFHSKNSQNSNLALKKNNWKWGENLIVK